MVDESQAFEDQVRRFSSLVACSEHLAPLRSQLARCGATDIRLVPMAQGAKQSRFLAWTFR